MITWLLCVLAGAAIAGGLALGLAGIIAAGLPRAAWPQTYRAAARAAIGGLMFSAGVRIIMEVWPR